MILATLNNGGTLLAVNAFYLQIIDQSQGRRA
jgi:hypothetical protein